MRGAPVVITLYHQTKLRLLLWPRWQSSETTKGYRGAHTGSEEERGGERRRRGGERRREEERGGERRRREERRRGGERRRAYARPQVIGCGISTNCCVQSKWLFVMVYYDKLLFIHSPRVRAHSIKSLMQEPSCSQKTLNTHCKRPKNADTGKDQNQDHSVK